MAKKDKKDESVVETPETPEASEKDVAGESGTEKGKKKKSTKKPTTSAEDAPRDAEVVETTEKHEEDGVEVETTTRVRTTGKGKEKKKKSTKKKSTKKTKKPIVWWPWILAGGMVASAIILCLCGRCRDKKSGRHERAKTEVVCDSCGGTTFIENYYDYGDHVQAEDHSQVTYSKQVVTNSQNVNQANNTNAANHSRVNTPRTVKPCPQERVIVYDTVRVDPKPVEQPKDTVKQQPTVSITLEAKRHDVWVCWSY